jgi:hypothetical protein
LLSLAATAAGSAPIFLTGDVSWPGAAGSAAIDAGGDEVVTLRGHVPNAIIGPAMVRNAYRVVTVSRSANVSRMLVQGLTAQVTDACVRAQADVVVVRDTRCLMTGGPQSGGINMPFGLDVISARTVSVEDSRFEGFQWRSGPNRYWNGDGITIERGVEGVQFRRVSSNDNTDAGFDVRPFALLSDVSASGNCRNFRFWSGAEAGTLTTGDVVKRGGISSCSAIWLNGSASGARPKLHIRRLVVRMSRPARIIEVETGPADIEIDQCDIEAPPGTEMIEFDRGAGKVVLGDGCRLGRAGPGDRAGLSRAGAGGIAS